MTQMLYDAGSGTTIPFDPEHIFLVDVEQVAKKLTYPDFGEDLDDEDPHAQAMAREHGESLASLLPQTSGRTKLSLLPEDIRSGDLILEGGQIVMVEQNDGPSYSVPGTRRIETPIATLYLDAELPVTVLRED